MTQDCKTLGEGEETHNQQCDKKRQKGNGSTQKLCDHLFVEEESSMPSDQTTQNAQQGSAGATVVVDRDDNEKGKQTIFAWVRAPNFSMDPEYLSE